MTIVIESGEYGKAQRALADDPIIIAMANEIRGLDMEQFLHDDGLPRFEFMMAAMRKYQSSGGTIPSYGIGDFAKAILLVLDTPLPIIETLTLYRSGSQWVYDDAKHGRVAEPLVRGASEILDNIIVFDLGQPTRDPVVATFSDHPFPYAHMGKWIGEEDGGNWYTMEGEEAWLCPALFDYFKTAPPELFVKVIGKVPPMPHPEPDNDMHSVHADIWDMREGK